MNKKSVSEQLEDLGLSPGDVVSVDGRLDTLLVCKAFSNSEKLVAKSPQGKIWGNYSYNDITSAWKLESQVNDKTTLHHNFRAVPVQASEFSDSLTAVINKIVSHIPDGYKAVAFADLLALASELLKEAKRVEE